MAIVLVEDFDESNLQSREIVQPTRMQHQQQGDDKMADDDDESMHSIELTPSLPLTPTSQIVNELNIIANNMIMSSSHLNNNLLPPPPPPYPPPSTAYRDSPPPPPMPQPRKQPLRPPHHPSQRQELPSPRHQSYCQSDIDPSVSEASCSTTLGSSSCDNDNASYYGVKESSCCSATSSCACSSQSTALTTSRYTANNSERNDESGRDSTTLDGCELSLSSTSYGTATDHVFVGNVTVILLETGDEHEKNNNKSEIGKVYRDNNNKDIYRDYCHRHKRTGSQGSSGSRESNENTIPSIDDSSRIIIMDKLKDKSKRWKTKKRQSSSRHKRPPTSPKSADKDTPVIQNRKKPVVVGKPVENASSAKIKWGKKQQANASSSLDTTNSSPNLFLQMGDHEVGNEGSNHHHAHLEDSYLSHGSQVTGSTTCVTSLSSNSNKSSPNRVLPNLNESALGSAAAGLRFHPHAGQESFDEDEDYYPTPIKGKSSPIKSSPFKGSAASVVAGVDKKGSPKGKVEGTKKKPSPQSVTEGVGATLTSFDRYQRKDKKARDSKRGSKTNNTSLLTHDSSYDDSETMAEGDDEATNESIVGSILDDDDASHSGTVSGLQRALFNSPLDKFHDFITGNVCWSNTHTTIMGKIQDGCADTANAGDALIDDVIDDYDYDDEEEGTMGEDTGTGEEETGDDDDERSFEVSYYTSEDDDGGRLIRADSSMLSSSLASSRVVPITKKQKSPKKKKTTPPKGGKKNSRSSQPTRRGRSPTAKLGYNSDGDSLLQSSQSRSTNSPRRGTSLSLSTRNSSTSATGQGHLRAENPIMIQGFQGVPEAENGSDGSTAVGRRDHSVAAESIAESVLSQDQATWLDMTRAYQPSSHAPPSSAGAGTSPAEGNENEMMREAVVADSPLFVSREVNAIEGYFKKLLTVGIQLLLNDPPTSESTSPRLNRSGKMFLQFGTRTVDDGNFEHPRLLWTDGQDVSYTLELLDIQSIRPPDMFELEESNYPFAIPNHSFFVTTNGGTELLFEAVDELQMIRVTTSLRGIIGRLAKKIVMGENDWVVQMMLASVRGVTQSLEELEAEAPYAMVDVTDQLVKKTTTASTTSNMSGLMRQAQERRNRMRSTRHQ